MGSPNARVLQMRRGPGGAPIASSSAPISRIGPYQRRSEHATSSLTPLVTTLRGPCLPSLTGKAPSLGAARSVAAAASSKATTALDRGAFHRRILSPPAGINEKLSPISPVHGVALATAIRLPARVHLPVSREREGRARPRALRPGPSAVRRLLQPKQSTSTTTYRPSPDSAPGTRLSPRCRRVLPLRAVRRSSEIG